MKKNFFTTSRTARYFTLGELNDNTTRIWLLLHGYAQNADTFLERFEALVDEETFLIAPEGLSHFYWKDFVGEPVSSWMTKLDREQEINDINNYLSGLYNSFIKVKVEKGVELHCLGFSQGCPSLMRWLFSTPIPYNKLVLLAGEPAHDLNYASASDEFKLKGIDYVYGDKDPLVSVNKVTYFSELMRRENVKFKVHKFNGKHEVNEKVISILKQIQ